MTDFDRIARRLIDETGRPLRERLSVFRRLCPGVDRQIREDRDHRGPLAFWGWCRNTDEVTGGRIVEPEILELLASTARRRFRPECPHAGLQHTYGYLFSLLDTPCRGRKRDRWTNPWLEQGFGLPAGTVSPQPQTGTLLANATLLAGGFAFAGHRRMSALSERLSGRADSAIPQVFREALLHHQLIETAKAEDREGRTVTLQFRTSLIRMPFADRVAIPAPWLLVYSIADSRRRDPQLITLFTVSDQTCEEITLRARRRHRSDIRPRYNAHVPGIRQGLLSGRCELKRDRRTG